MLITSTLDVNVFTPKSFTLDALNNKVVTYDKTKVEGVLVAPASTDDLGADRPDGYTVRCTVHFPKSFVADITGAYIEGLPAPYPSRVWVIGNPVPYMPELTPGQWNRAAVCGVADG